MIFVDNRQNIIDIDENFQERIKEVIEFALKEEGVSVPYEVSVIFINNKDIKDLNKEMRNVDRVTDVLSFPMLQYPKGKTFKDCYKSFEFDGSFLDGEDLVLGDIALSLQKAEEQCLEFGHSFLRESAYLTVHSVLHLLGYDHMEEEEKKIMRKREEEILDRLEIKR